MKVKDILTEVTRRDFLKGVGVAALGAASTSSHGHQPRDRLPGADPTDEYGVYIRYSDVGDRLLATAHPTAMGDAKQMAQWLVHMLNKQLGPKYLVAKPLR